MACNVASAVPTTVMNDGAAYVVATTGVDCSADTVFVATAVHINAVDVIVATAEDCIGASVDFCAVIDAFAKMTVDIGAAVLNNSPTMIIATSMYPYATAVFVLFQSFEQHAVVAALGVAVLVEVSAENIRLLLGLQGGFSLLFPSSPPKIIRNSEEFISVQKSELKVLQFF